LGWVSPILHSAQPPCLIAILAKVLTNTIGYKAQSPHEGWFIDGRQMDLTLHGTQWWSIVILEGYSRTMLAAAVAPSEASWVAMLVLYTACRRYGVPQRMLSDSGGASISNAFEAVCARLEIEHITIVSTQGESWLNIMETHFN